MKKAVLASAITLVLVSISGCALNGQRIAKLPISSKKRRRYAIQVANTAKPELDKNQFGEFYSLILEDVSKTNPKLDSIENVENNSLLLEKAGYKNIPIPTYALDVNNLALTPTSDYSDKLIINDTLHTHFISYKNNDVLGVIYARKLNNKWEGYEEEPNSMTINSVDSSTYESSSTIRAIKYASKYSNNLFIIVYTKPSLSFISQTIGFAYNGHINVISRHSSKYRYDSVKDWLLDEKIIFKDNGIKQIIK